MVDCVVGGDPCGELLFVCGGTQGSCLQLEALGLAFQLRAGDDDDDDDDDIHSFSSIMGPKPVWLVPFKAPPHWAFNAFGAAPPPKRPPAAAIPVRPGVDGGPPFKAPPPYPAVEAPQPPPPPLADAVHRYVLRIICRACSEGYPHSPP